MATNCERSTKRVALCSALAAGFAYVGYSILRNAFCRRECKKGGKHKLQDKTNQAIQTDLSLAFSSDALLLLPELCAIRKSVKERVKELNYFARQHGSSEFCPGFKPRSLQSSPWSSPRILGSTDTRKFISYSAENISSVSPTKSPSVKKHSLPSAPNGDSYNNSTDDTACEDSETCDTKMIEESEETIMRRLDSLFNRARVITPYEAKSLVSLLNRKDTDILVKALSAISNCSAFTINQDFFCDADCPNMLRELLTHASVTVKIAATQAMSNLASNEKSQAIFQSCIPVLLHHATNRDGELLKKVSLMALANLALYNDNHNLIIGNIQQLMDMLENNQSGEIQLQALKVLVNLSCNNSVVPAILASKAPAKLYSYLDEKNDYDLCLRMTTLLANVMTTASELNLQISDLPIEHKAPCPETLFVVIFGYFGREILLKKVTHLLDSKDDDICHQATRIHDIVTKLY